MENFIFCAVWSVIFIVNFEHIQHKSNSAILHFEYVFREAAVHSSSSKSCYEKFIKVS